MVSEYRDVFLTDSPGMSSDRVIDFCIDLDLGNHVIYIPSYHIALEEL